MSWEKAKREAEAWLRSLGLESGVRGKYVDLSDKGETLKVEGGFRLMVLRAAERLLTKRGATSRMPK